ncbi:MAG: CRISPR-associated endonuclease Cas2 [Caldilineales bacterium]|nr:CRISPR-associated endonuclease Cas2 [Caldilineales bacterium]
MAAVRFYVIAYDVADDKRRLRLAKLLQRQGERVQHSVFEVYLTAAELDRLVRSCRRMIKKEEDSIRFYALCDACAAKILVLGQAQVTEPPGVRIV